MAVFILTCSICHLSETFNIVSIHNLVSPGVEQLHILNATSDLNHNSENKGPILSTPISTLEVGIWRPEAEPKSP